MTDTPNPPTAPHRRTARTHLLAQARVRSLTARPVGPFRVNSAHAFRAGGR